MHVQVSDKQIQWFALIYFTVLLPFFICGQTVESVTDKTPKHKRQK